MAKQRRLSVWGIVVGALGVTSAVLLAIAPEPLRPAGNSLASASTPQPAKPVFLMATGPSQTDNSATGSTFAQTPLISQVLRKGTWSAIAVEVLPVTQAYLPSAGGNQPLLASHFLLTADGQLKVGQSWMKQHSAQWSAKPVFANPNQTIRIVVGLNNSADEITPAQRQQLKQLVIALQQAGGIADSAVRLSSLQ